MQYGNLIEIGRRIVDEKVPRPAGERALRWALKEGMTSPVFGPAMKAGQAVRALLPAVLKNKVPPAATKAAHRWPTRTHARKVLMLAGCVQPVFIREDRIGTVRCSDPVGDHSQCERAQDFACLNHRDIRRVVVR